MDTINSFKGYGKVDPAEEQAYRRKTRRRIIIVVVSAVLLVGLIIGVVAGTVAHKKNKSSGGSGDDATPGSPASVEAMCSVTEYKESCMKSLSPAAAGGKVKDPLKLFVLSLKMEADSLAELASRPAGWMNGTKDKNLRQAFEVCRDVFDDAVQRLNDSIASMEVHGVDGKILSSARIADLKTWLSAAITDQETCLDALEEIKANATVVDNVKGEMKNSTEFASNSLAIVTHIISFLGNLHIPIHRKLLTANQHSDGFPGWVKPGDRRLLQAENPTPDVVVDKNGSPGSVKTIKEAVDKIPPKSTSRFVIYVMAGEYKEKLELDKSKWNVMMYGDGMGKTIITGSDNYIDKTATFKTATFTVVGQGFIARDITFQNTAGAEKHQAVAMRSGSDQSVFYHCSFDGYQDTLYAHSNRQFYRECHITGTIDFIFGSASVVFQGCKIQPRQPLPNQYNTITAQGKTEPNLSSGISIQKCDISPLGEVTVPTYLGRPWKPYSTTVIMQSSIGSLLKPQGWIEWFPNVTPPATIFYAEYMNTGAGAGVDQRVKWDGYHPSITSDQASKFTVQSFIDGDQWLSGKVIYELTL
ncbi:PREDICTED: pectinesterase 3-like [Ipomoea nil]|uniref:pectinesterase 3-like n=1 Tax=Ipomoea nil TaxID=35883 RepID=UPI0009009DDF|nr:PREDICTED: pectinesterase 3-like [Ipomoea nil]